MTQLSINAISNGSLKAPSLKADQSTLTLIRSTIAQRPCTIIIALLAIVLSLGGFGATLASSLELTRDSLIEGRLWTILTGPLLHVSFQHLVFDVLGLLIVGWIFEPMLKRGMFVVVMAINIAVAVAAFAIYPHVDSYFGLSALDQGLLAAGAVALAMNRNMRPALIIAGVLALKWIGELAFDQSSLGLVSTDPARYGTPVPWCHAVGGIAGALGAWGWMHLDRICQRRAQGAGGISCRKSDTVGIGG